MSKIQERRSKWSAGKLGAKIVVPPELEWWYWLEFGTASRGDAGGPSYSITPVDSTYLVFPQEGATTFSKGVQHPGVAPRRSVTKVLPNIETDTLQKINAALHAGAADDPALMQDALMSAVMQAKALIVDSISVNIPGTRPVNVKYPKQSGKLLGNTAASVFDSAAQIVPSSS